MHNVKNRKVIRRLSFNIMKANRKRNAVIILAVMLTCILFTSLFSIGISIVKGSEESTMRQVGGKSMAGVKCILPKDYDKLIKDSAVKNPTYRITIGEAVNHKLLKLSTEVNYAEAREARAMFCYPTVGAMPQDRLELATSTLVLDALGIPHQLGETVALEFTVNGKKMEQDFTLCGYWEGDSVAMAQQCWLSRAYCDEVAPTPLVSFQDTDMTTANYAGYWMMDFDFSNSWNIEGKTIALLNRNGYNPNVQGYGVNWAYTTSSVDTQTVVLLVVVLATIILSGYLIVYNVFYINVTADIKKYGLLKTIGTTGRQLKRIVRQQALLLSILGIPLGMILGTLLSRYLLPIIVENFEIGKMVFTISPVIYILAAGFTYLTVWIGSGKSCRFASKVSPMEAVRYTEKHVSKKKEKRSYGVNPVTMAAGNIRRSRKKVFVVVFSLSLCMILVNSVFLVVNSFDADKYVATSIIGDFAVTNATVLDMSKLKRNFSGVSEAVRQDLTKIDGVKQVSNIYCKEASTIELDDKSLDKVKQFANQHKELFELDYAKQELDYSLGNKKLFCSVYGMDRFGFDNLTVQEGKLDWNKFETGDYVVLYTYDIELDEQEASDAMFYHVGDRVSLKLPDGTVKEYTVMAIAEIPYAMSNKSFYTLGANAVIPAREYLQYTKDTGALYSIINVEDDKTKAVEEYLQNYTTIENPDLTYVSKQTYLEDFDNYTRMIWIVGGALSIILALIGILNFINAIVTSLIARRQKIAMLEAVGMTGKQLKAMLMCEGMIYAGLTAAFSVTFGSLIGYGLVRAVAGQIWFFSYRFTLLPIALCLPVLVLLSCLIPYVSYRGMCKTSIVERIKVAE